MTPAKITEPGRIAKSLDIPPMNAQDQALFLLVCNGHVLIQALEKVLISCRAYQLTIAS